MKKCLIYFFVVCRLFSNIQSQDIPLNSLLPLHSANEQIIKHIAYILKYNENYEQADWVIYSLTHNRANGSFHRTDNFRPDPYVSTGSAQLIDYKSSGFDRGHLAPAADMAWSSSSMSESFYLSNMSPQRPGFNRGIWKNLETLIRDWTIDFNELYIVTGPVLTSGLLTIGPNQVSVPEYFYKVVLARKDKKLCGIGFVLANQSSSLPLKQYAVSIDSVEKLTHIDFFPALNDDLESRIESVLKTDLFTWGNTTTSISNNVEPQPQIQSPPIIINPSSQTTQNQTITVYITRTGTKYHRGSCSYLKKSKIPISLKDAKAQGYTPCSRCRP